MTIWARRKQFLADINSWLFSHELPFVSVGILPKDKKFIIDKSPTEPVSPHIKPLIIPSMTHTLYSKVNFENLKEIILKEKDNLLFDEWAQHQLRYRKTDEYKRKSGEFFTYLGLSNALLLGMKYGDTHSRHEKRFHSHP